ncbi:hypothetical protein ACP70R_025096 [Stipagrostis hirtigluma subsp. patula]
MEPTADRARLHIDDMFLHCSPFLDPLPSPPPPPLCSWSHPRRKSLCRPLRSPYFEQQAGRRQGVEMAAIGSELPDDVLADVLRRVPPRGLAVSRCVCKAWREVVDSRRLLRTDLLPRSVGGIFLNYRTLFSPEFFARPTTGPTISADLNFIPDDVSLVTGHCNGLLLCSGQDDYVANPATRQWAVLPPCPTSPMGEAFDQTECLVYDPALSPHYEVFSIPFLPYEPETELDSKMLDSQWPPSFYPLQVFSSATGRWEQRMFDREGSAAGTVADMKQSRLWVHHHAVYWRGALYVHSNKDIIMRISMANEKYQIIPMPLDIEVKYNGRLHFGRSEKGVYCALRHDWYGLQIFLLNESCGQIGWELKHHVNLGTLARKLHALEDYGQKISGPWILLDINYYNIHIEALEENFEWSSDDDDVLNVDDMLEESYGGSIGFLGFHPYKEIVFLNAHLRRCVAYHWNTSKFQDLGNIFPKDYDEIDCHVAKQVTSFPFTPCWMEDLPETNWEAYNQD